MKSITRLRRLPICSTSSAYLLPWRSQRATHETAMKELARVSEIVTQTLRFHREQSKPVMVQVPEIVDSALVLYQARLTSAQIVIERDFRECRPILARSGELRQVILNLVGKCRRCHGEGRYAENPRHQHARTQQWHASWHSFDHRRYRIRDSPRNQGRGSSSRLSVQKAIGPPAWGSG